MLCVCSVHPVMDTIVYVDRFNLYYAVKKHPGCKRLDLSSLADRVLGPKFTVIKVRCFTALVTRPERSATSAGVSLSVRFRPAFIDPFRQLSTEA